MIKALALNREESGCSFHRIFLPFFHSDQVDNKFFEGKPLATQINSAELLVWNRDCPIGYKKAKQRKRENGTKLCVDFDDDIELGKDHFLYQHYKRYKITEQLIENIKIADLVTVTTERLKQSLSKYHDNIHVIPNALPFDTFQFTAPSDASRLGRRPNIIYTGQSSHRRDVKIISPVLLEIAKSNRASFSLAGYDGSAEWNKIEKEFTSNGQLRSYNRIPLLPLFNYMNCYNAADISIVPLEDNHFNSCKSNLKLLEAASKKLPVVCSNVAPYSDDPEAPVSFVSGTVQWQHAIERLVDLPGARKADGQKLYDWANAKYNLFNWNKVRFDLYKKTIES